jgi:TatD DNase family protein
MGVEFIDTHAHLYADEFKDDLAEVILRAQEKGIYKVLLPNIDLDSIEPMKKIVREYPKYFVPMMGLHPCSVKPNYKEELDVVLKELQENEYCAVGEVGMDLYWDQSTKAIQDSAFRMQCQWAADLKLPLAIHSRNSTREILDILQDLKGLHLRGVFHCFSGTEQEAEELIDLGFYLGIGGVLTFKNSGLKDAIRNVSLQHIVLETDSPYLAPTPFRGKRNESSYVDLVADHMSELYGISKDDIAAQTSSNASRLFHI